MGLSKDQKWRKWIRELKERAPLTRPVSVRRVKSTFFGASASHDDPQKHSGECYTSNGKFVIRVSALDPIMIQQETLLHEWAHCIAYPDQLQLKTAWTHDDVFGVAYAFVLRRFHKESAP